MKRKTILTLTIGSLSLLSSVAVVTSSIAWFTQSAHFNNGHNPYIGTVEDAYYAYGLGTEESPFGITRPRHLYNLAWLQYLGFYNYANDHQYYFELAADIDMSGYSALPPIGTELNPFVGHFDGQSHTISNLNVSNDFRDYTLHPAVVSGFDNNTKKQPHILGLFGVIGNYESVEDVYEPTVNIQNAYDTSINTLTNTGIVNIKVKSVVNDSLVGLAAGYVNTDISGIAVDSGKLDVPDVSGTTSYPIVNAQGVYTNNISDYGLVGYTTKKTSIKKVNNELYDLQVRGNQEYVANWQGSNAGWGGSIDMNSIFKRLNGFSSHKDAQGNYVNDYSRSSYPFNYTHKHLNDDIDPRYPDYPDDDTTGNQSVYKFVGYGQDDDEETPNNNEYSEDYRGSVVFCNKEFSTSTEIGKIYLAGGTYHVHDYYESYDESNGYRITDGSGNYLIFDGSGLTNSTDSNCHVWEFETTSNSGVGYIRTLYEGNYYYLMNSGNTLAIERRNSDIGATDWTINVNGNNLGIIDSSVSPALSVLFYNDAWRLLNPNAQVEIIGTHSALMDTSQTYYIRSTIINNSNTNVGSVTDGEQVYFETPTNGSQVVCRDSNGNRYWLFAYYNNGSSYITARNSSTRPGNNYYALNYDSSGPYVRGASGSYYYYLRLNGTNWVCTRQRTNSGTTYRISFVSKPAINGRPYQNLHLSNTLNNSIDYHREEEIDSRHEEGMKFSYDDTTYFPINVYGQDTYDADNNQNIVGYANEALATNTGYFVAGTTDKTWSGNDGSSPRSIIISNYSKSTKLKSACYSGDAFVDSEIYTIDNNGAHALNLNDEEKYTKYETSKSGLESVLSTANNSKGIVGGFHFFAKNPDLASPSMNSIVKARDIRMRNAEYREYELPVYSIDFYLKEQGRINFLAGMYNGGSENGSHTDAFGNNIPAQNYGTVTPTSGTSGNKMNGFFSLFKIDRSGSTITNIRKIKAIYEQEDSNTYVYTYVDGKCTIALDGTTTCNLVDEDGNAINNLNQFIDDNNLNLLFDTQWIWYRPLHGDPGRVYYFEIPVDEGEYCLGGYETPNNVEMDGAYMMYLDIGANASQMQRTMVAEHFLEDTYSYSYPSGVALIPVSTVGTENFKASNSACFVVLPSYRGEVIVDRDDTNHVQIAREADYTNVLKPNYVSDVIVSVVDPGITENESGTTFGTTGTPIDLKDSIVHESKVSKETYRVEYYDYNVRQELLTKTVIEDTRTKTDNANWTALSRKITQQVGNGSVIEFTSQNQVNNGIIAIFKYLGALHNDTGKVWTYSEIINTSSTVFYDTSAKTTSAACGALTTEVLELYHLLEGDVTAETDFKVELVEEDREDSKVFYVFNNFVVVPTVANGRVVYTVKYINSAKTIYFIDNGTTLTMVDQSVTANPPAVNP